MPSKKTELIPTLPVITIVRDANRIRPRATHGLAAVASRQHCLTKVLAEAAALDFLDCTVTYDGVVYNDKDEISLYATACGVARK
ncbi:hypothetical protein PR002_g3760 [Phytophthora rubi]|uniref:Uncharacterized protein n=1 Tax=Phytophthora rubi TaxID=129364 RepID=A0A6A3NKD4_9STRA|nr:hypothetical protein PR002_g3760 [Phytophthora rubi]